MKTRRQRKLKVKEKKIRKQEFELWLATIDERIQFLKSSIPDEIKLKIDGSLSSLHILEKYITSVYEEHLDVARLENKPFFDAVATYIGEVIRNHASSAVEWTFNEYTYDDVCESDWDTFYPVLDLQGAGDFLVFIQRSLYHKEGNELYNCANGFLKDIQTENEAQSPSPQYQGLGGYAHQVYILIKDGQFTFDKLIEKLTEVSSASNQYKLVHFSDKRLIIQFEKGYCFNFYFDKSEGVVIESKEFSQAYSGEQSEEIAQCSTRIEFWGDQDDDMGYLNDFILLMESFEGDPNLIIFDYHNNCILGE